MTETPNSPPIDLGIYGRTENGAGMDSTDRVALVASAAWILAAIVFLTVAGVGSEDALGPIRFLIIMLAFCLPVALIWIGAIAVKSARIIRDESERLQASMDAMRQIYVSQAQIAATTMGPNVERKIDEIVKAQQRAEETLSQITPPSERIMTSPPPLPSGETTIPVEDGQVALEFVETAPTPQVNTLDFIAALNFPETADDKAGFDALKRALADPRASIIIRASQDVLTLLSQDGIYMDDLQPDRARPEVWRRFASGERGPTVAAIGGIHDRSSLTLSAARMRQDTIFRDSVHHFLRAFDRTLSQWSDQLSDQELAILTETRTARAFMLLGRVARIF
ncbi:MAG: hypothetical protein AAF718_10010 [Pseudomonadota bacterium]